MSTMPRFLRVIGSMILIKNSTLYAVIHLMLNPIALTYKGDIRFEPQSALTSPENGLADISLIVQSAPQYLYSEGLILEHGFAQGSAIQALFACAGFTDIQTLCDYAQQPRITLGRMS